MSMKRVRHRKLKIKGFIFEGNYYRHILKKDKIDSAINGLSIIERNTQEADSQKKNMESQRKRLKGFYMMCQLEVEKSKMVNLCH